MRINKHDTNGVKPLLGKGELGYDDYQAGGDVGRVYVGTGSENIALAEKLEANMITKAQFNALAEERKANRGGSGFEEMGKHNSVVATYPNINEGMWTWTTPNSLILGKDSAQNTGVSKTLFPVININGVISKLFAVNSNSSYCNIILPPAPNIYPHDTVLTAEQIASGVIKHADSSNSGLIVNGKFDVDTSGWTASTNATLSVVANKIRVTSTSSYGYAYQAMPTTIGKTYIVEFGYTHGTNTVASLQIGNGTALGTALQSLTTVDGRFTVTFTAIGTTTYLGFITNGIGLYADFDNIAVYPADAISRSDLVFLESWHEDVSEKNFAYDNGNTQSLNTANIIGVTPTNGNFTGFETYSLFGNWQTPSALIGKGYVWGNLTEAQKRAFIANPENNCYLDGDKVIQVRYRVRVVQGLGDSWKIDGSSNINPDSVNGWVETGFGGANFYLAPKGKKVYQDEFSTLFPAYRKGITDLATLGYAGIGHYYALQSVNANDVSAAYEGKCFALPIALIHRRNQGMYHNVYNPNGTKLASDGLDCFRTTVSFTSISDCFDTSKLLATSGYIGSVSGRPDGLFYDQVHERDITDLRNSSKKVKDYNRLIGREFNKLVAGTNRGKEFEWETRISFGLGNFLYDYDDGRVRFYTYDSKMNLQIGDVVQVTYYNGTNYISDRVVVSSLYIDATYSFLGNCPNIAAAISSGATTSNGIRFFMYSNKSTRTKSNTLLHCDIIGNPSNYPTAWKQSGVFGTPLIVAEDGTSLLPDGAKDTFKLSRKANATPLLCLRSTDSGVTWTSFTPTFSTPTNEITLTNEPAGNLVMVYYQTHTVMAVPVVNSEVLEIGDVWAGNSQYTTLGNTLVNSLIGKTSVGITAPAAVFNGKSIGYKFYNSPIEKFDIATEYRPNHTAIAGLGATASPTVKVLPYLTRTNGKAYLNLVFKEMKYNGTSWGDDSKFNIADNVSTTTDNNAQTVLIGQKTVELPYFIGADE